MGGRIHQVGNRWSAMDAPFTSSGGAGTATHLSSLKATQGTLERVPPILTSNL